MKARKVTLDTLRPGDVVRLSDGPYMTATVKNVENGRVTFFRPYVSASEYTYAGGIICTVGIEEFSTSRTDQTWDLLS